MVSLYIYIYIYFLPVWPKKSILFPVWQKNGSNQAQLQVLAVVSTGNSVPAEDPTSPTLLMNAKTQSMEQIPNLMVATWRLATLCGLICGGVYWGVFQDIRFLEDGCIVCVSLNTGNTVIEWLVGGARAKFHKWRSKSWNWGPNHFKEKSLPSNFSWATGYDVIVQCDSDNFAVSEPFLTPKNSSPKPKPRKTPPWDETDVATRTGALLASTTFDLQKNTVIE